MNILLFSHDSAYTDLICSCLVERGHVVRTIQTQVDQPVGHYHWSTPRPDLVVLCTAPSHYDIDSLAALAPFSGAPPILLITSSSRPSDIAEALEAGAADVLVRPVHTDELIMTINAIFRRRPTSIMNTWIRFGALGLDLAARAAYIEEASMREPLATTSTEFAILRLLVAAQGSPVPYSSLVQAERRSGPMSIGALRSHMANIRTKLARIDQGATRIEAIPGLGYTLVHDG